jgi:GNAT superfamily N-acetyltransferase
MKADLPIRRLDTGDAEALVALRRQALETEPLAFASSVDDDIGLALDSVQTFLRDREAQAVFGHFDRADLVGMVGLVRASKVKQRHKATIWGMYVLPRARSKGLGGALLDAAVQQAREWRVELLHLCVTEAAPLAKRLYEAAGFREWGREARALHWKGRFVDDHHLVLDLHNLRSQAG